MTAKQYVALVHRLDCLICVFMFGHRTPMQEAHHVIPGDDWSVVPLCRDHHQGPLGVHGKHRVGFYRYWKISDLWLLARTVELLGKK